MALGFIFQYRIILYTWYHIGSKSETFDQRAFSKTSASGVGTSAPIIGRYERNEIKPSIETAKNIADALGVTIDYLIGGSDTMVMDKEIVQRMEAIQDLSDKEKESLFFVLDNFLQNIRTKVVFAK